MKEKYTVDIKSVKSCKLDEVSDLIEESQVIVEKDLGLGSTLYILRSKDGTGHLLISCTDGDYYYCKVQTSE